MKSTKRIFIALLIVAVILSSLTVFASAEEYGVQDYVNVLEYFEKSVLFDYDFTGEDVDYSASFIANRPLNRVNQITDELVASDSAPFGKYLSVGILERTGRVAYSSNHAYLAWSSDEAIDDFNIDMTVSGSLNDTSDEADEHLPKIVVVVGDTKLDGMDNAHASGVTVASVNYRKGCFTYLKAVTGADGVIYGKEVDTDFVIEADAWYTVSLTYDVDRGVSITVTDCSDSEKSITVTDGYIPYESVKDIRIGAHGDDDGSARGSRMNFAKVRLLGGIYHRDVNNMVADVEEKIIGMYELFLDEDAAVGDKIVVCDVVKAIKSYGFVSENPEVQKVIEDLGIGAVGLYNSKIAYCIANCNSLPTYAEKRVLADESYGFSQTLKTMEVPEDMANEVSVNIMAMESLYASLIHDEEQSLAFIAGVNEIESVDFDDYGFLKEQVDKLSVYTPDLTYEGVAEAYDLYSRISDAELEMRTKGEKFISAVGVLTNEELDFNVRADAYREISDSYFDNETYPGITEALAAYVTVAEDISAEITKADNFIIYVNKASYAVYVTAKQENLDIAKTFIDCNPEYRGVKEAMALYDEVQAFVNQQVKNAKDYIAAVDALRRLTGNALLKGIEKAQSLQEAGNVLGVDGVTEANIALNKVVAEIELEVKYSEYFLGLVAAIYETDDLSERFEAIKAAKAAEADADKWYAGVNEASIQLADAIAEYNEAVRKVNADFESANEVAAKAVGSGCAHNKSAGIVIGVIKRLFDEEYF